MSTRIARIASCIVALTPALLLVGVDAAFAANAGTGIAALDATSSNLTKFVQGLAAIACIFLLGVLVWDFVQHRNIGRSIFEFLGVIVLGVIAFNAGTVAAQFQGTGALL